MSQKGRALCDTARFIANKDKFIDFGAFDVFYQKPEQKGVIVKHALGFQLKKGYEAYSKVSRIDVFKDLQASKHRLVRTGKRQPAKR